MFPYQRLNIKLFCTKQLTDTELQNYHNKTDRHDRKKQYIIPENSIPEFLCPSLNSCISLKTSSFNNKQHFLTNTSEQLENILCQLHPNLNQFHVMASDKIG